MNRYLWPEENICDKCEKTDFGSMVYINDIPIGFVCENCDPNLRQQALTTACNVAHDPDLIGWSWFENH